MPYPYVESKEKTGKQPIKVRWMDVNNGTTDAPEIRCRLEANEIKTNARPDLVAGAPPVESLYLLLSMAASTEEPGVRHAQRCGPSIFPRTCNPTGVCRDRQRGLGARRRERVRKAQCLHVRDTWRSLLGESGFQRVHLMRGGGFLCNQAVMVARAGRGGEQRSPEPRLEPELAHLFTGGLGGLGLLTSRLLVSLGATRLVLSSRSGRVQHGSEGDWKWLSEDGSHSAVVTCVQSDVSEESSVLATLRDLHWGGARLGGIFHAAGVLSDALLADQEAWRFRAVFAPKVHGASCLQRGVACVGLRHFLVYSSVAALLGAPGQAPHSAANTWLDSFTHWRRSLGLAGVRVKRRRRVRPATSACADRRRCDDRSWHRCGAERHRRRDP